jgi:hypothetical protein
MSAKVEDRVRLLWRWCVPTAVVELLRLSDTVLRSARGLDMGDP